MHAFILFQFNVAKVRVVAALVSTFSYFTNTMSIVYRN